MLMGRRNDCDNPNRFFTWCMNYTVSYYVQCGCAARVIHQYSVCVSVALFLLLQDGHKAMHLTGLVS